MKEHIIEIVIDENGELYVETKGMEGKICVDELDKVLFGVEGKRIIDEKTSDYYKKPRVKQTIKIGK